MTAPSPAATPSPEPAGCTCTKTPLDPHSALPEFPIANACSIHHPLPTPAPGVSGETGIEALIEASSLGTPDAKALRDSVSPDVARVVVTASKYLARAEAAEARIAAALNECDQMDGATLIGPWLRVRAALRGDAVLAALAPGPASVDVEAACEVMHDAYEKVAVGAGWGTQQASRKPWADVPEANKATMRVTVEALLTWLAPGPDTARSLLEEGRVLASERDDLIARGVNPADLEVPLAGPDTARNGAASTFGLDDLDATRAERDAARRELGEFKTAVERLCDDADAQDHSVHYGPPMITIATIRDLLTTAGSEGAPGDEGGTAGA